jgi:hypothetical protein
MLKITAEQRMERSRAAVVHFVATDDVVKHLLAATRLRLTIENRVGRVLSDSAWMQSSP